MNEKTLEPESRYSKYDLDGDGVVTDEELEMDAKMMRLENEDKKEDAQRYMAWFALFGMLLYPSLVVFSTFVGLDKAASILGDMAATYFVSVAAIVAAFFGKEAYVKSKNAEVSIKKQDKDMSEMQIGSGNTSQGFSNVVRAVQNSGAAVSNAIATNTITLANMSYPAGNSATAEVGAVTVVIT